MVELLVATTMMSVLFVGLGTHLRGGIAVWHRATGTTEQLQRQRVAFDRLERDLANALIYDERPSSYGSEPGLLPLPTLAHDSLGWFTVAPAPGAPGAQAVRLVTYACGDAGGAAGLWRTSRSLGDARAGRPPARDRLLPDCARLSVRYATPSANPEEPMEWKTEWLSAYRSLPRFVEVSLDLASGRRLTHLFAIPIGTAAEPQAPGA